MIRLQSGWAKCEKERGKYDFAWLDEIVDWAKAHGLECMLETCYGNPLYKNGGNEALTGRIYAIPQENVLATDSGTAYVDVPCYDSPSVLTERHVVIK